MTLIQLINIATLGWRTAVVPEERIRQLTQLETWVAEQRRIAVAQWRGEPAGPGVHRAHEGP